MGRGRKQKTALIHINLLNVNIPILQKHKNQSIDFCYKYMVVFYMMTFLPFIWLKWCTTISAGVGSIVSGLKPL